MPFELIRHDITKIKVDVIVNTSNKYLRGGSGVNGAIHKAAGPELLKECELRAPCEVAQIVVTRGYRLPCKYIFHTVSPIWQDGKHHECELLSTCYRNALQIATAHHMKSIAFPLIASGAHGFPKDLAMKVATDTISDYLLHNVPDNDLMVYLVTFSKESLAVGSKLFADIKQYIDDNYVNEHFDYRRERSRRMPIMRSIEEDDFPVECAAAPMAMEEAWNPSSIEDALSMIDESFSEMVQRKIKEKGMKNAECYKKANIDKKLFSKIVNNANYKPKKTTALALAVALELSLEETKELLMKAGLALSHSDKFDIIVEFFIMHGKYDIFEINEMLYEFDQVLLGGALL